MDELSQSEAHDAGAACYLLANEQGKGRRETSSLRPSCWPGVMRSAHTGYRSDIGTLLRALPLCKFSVRGDVVRVAGELQGSPLGSDGRHHCACAEALMN